MKKTTVSFQGQSKAGAIAEPQSSRPKTPATSRRKASLAENRRGSGSAESPPRNGTRKNGAHEEELDVEQVLAALESIKKGDFSIRLPVAWTGMAGKVADSFNG